MQWRSNNPRAHEFDTLLAPYAVKHGEGLGREHPDQEDTYRLRFQRDADRIVETLAWKRLDGKTQVFMAKQGDHYRNRLTHTIEVSHLSRAFAGALCLNQDLAQCLAYAHDLGHAPFGHAGQDALNAWAQERGARFEHNEQSLRILTMLAEHCSLYRGLNVCIEILDGLQKHGTGPLTLEAQGTDCCDAIAYTGHDIEDGLRSEILTEKQLRESALYEEAKAMSQERGTRIRGTVMGLLMNDLIETTRERLSDIRTLEDVLEQSTRLVGYSDTMQPKLSELSGLLREHFYHHVKVQQRNDNAALMLTSLCNHYEANMHLIQNQTGSNDVESIIDYVSGMTDSYMQKQVIENKLQTRQVQI